MTQLYSNTNLRRLSRPEIQVLKVIDTNTLGPAFNQNFCPLSQEEMGEYLGCPRRTVSRMIVSLTHAGYIQPRAGKVRRYALTPRGKGVLTRLDNQ